jgi:hypothetical protein
MLNAQPMGFSSRHAGEDAQRHGVRVADRRQISDLRCRVETDERIRIN